jgi:hypothetical protein
MSLLSTINEQVAFGFSGRINVLLRNNEQLVGVVFQYEGKVIGSTSGKLKGKKALFNLIFEDVDSIDKFKFVVEPEIIGPTSFMYELNFEEIKSFAEAQYPEFLKAKKLRPPNHLKLLINPEIVVNHEEISADEFSVMEILTEYSSVNDVYHYSTLLEFEITNALVLLRKKKAIKVLIN